MIGFRRVVSVCIDKVDGALFGVSQVERQFEMPMFCRQLNICAELNSGQN